MVNEGFDKCAVHAMHFNVAEIVLAVIKNSV